MRQTHKQGKMSELPKSVIATLEKSADTLTLADCRGVASHTGELTRSQNQFSLKGFSTHAKEIWQLISK